MGKTIGLITALILILIALMANRYPTSPLFWEASVTTAFNILRCTISLLLFLFYIHTPKNKPFRFLFGLLTLLAVAWLWNGVYVGAVDLLTLSAAATSLLLNLLESKPADEPFKSMELIAAIRDLAVDKMRIAMSWGLQFIWLLITDIGISMDEFGTTAKKV